MNPLNRRPIDPEWPKRCDAAAERAANELSCLVVQISVQEGGKLSIAVAGTEKCNGPETDLCKQLLKHMPAFFLRMAEVCTLSAVCDEMETRQ